MARRLQARPVLGWCLYDDLIPAPITAVSVQRAAAQSFYARDKTASFKGRVHGSSTVVQRVLIACIIYFFKTTTSNHAADGPPDTRMLALGPAAGIDMRRQPLMRANSVPAISVAGSHLRAWIGARVVSSRSQNSVTLYQAAVRHEQQGECSPPLTS